MKWTKQTAGMYDSEQEGGRYLCDRQECPETGKTVWEAQWREDKNGDVSIYMLDMCKTLRDAKETCESDCTVF